PQVDLFNPVKPRNAAVQQESHIVRHTLDVEGDVAAEETVQDNGGFELKTSPSVFEFKLPTVFGAYEDKVNEEVEEEIKDIVDTTYTSTFVNTTKVEKKGNFENQLLKPKDRIFRLKELRRKRKQQNA